MNNTYTCLSCRLQSIVRIPSQKILRQRRWVSQGNQRRQGVEHRRNDGTHDGKFRSGQNNGEQGEQRIGRYSGRRLAPEQLLTQLETPPRRPQNEHRRQQPSSQTEMRSITRPQIGQDRSIWSPPDLGPRPYLGPHPHLERPMFKLRGLSITLKELSETADEEFWKATKEALRDTRDPENPKLLMSEVPFRHKLNHWINRVIDRWLQAEFDPQRDPMAERQERKDRLTPYQALKCRSHFALHPGLGYTRLMWLITSAVAEYDAQVNKPSQSTHPAVLEGLDELMRIWHLYMAINLCSSWPLSRLRELLDAPILDWSFLPDPTSFVDNIQQSQSQGGLKKSFNEIVEMLMTSSFPKVSSRKTFLQNEKFDIESSAMVTLGMLQAVRDRPGGAQSTKEFEPWIHFVRKCLKRAKIHSMPETLSRRMMDLSEEDPRKRHYKTIAESFHLDPEALKPGEGPVQGGFEQTVSSSDTSQRDDALIEGLTQVSVPNSSSSRANQMAYIAIKRLGRAVEDGNVRAADRVLQDVARFKTKIKEAVPQALYEHLIYSYLRLRSINKAVELWERMVQDGYEPRLKTYTTMMRGSQNLRDLNSMEYFWIKMRQAEIQPDATAWSTRIVGLLRYEHVEPGLKALSKMGQDWLSAAKQVYIKENNLITRRGKQPEVTAAQLLARYKGDLNGVPRPDVVIMNSAITALARGPDHLIPKVLAWGRSFGIEPDLITYNAFLHVAMRHNQGAEALKILQRMRERKIEVDSGTWTIILTDMLVGGYLDGLSADEQQEKVLEFLSVVEADATQSLGPKGYAMLMDRLLKNYDNYPAAQAVLTHMVSTGIEPGRHIYTILMDSHLQQSPPNFSAAEALWEYIHSAQGGYGANLDSKFFDLVIKGYAPHHAVIGIEKLLSILERMDKEGKRPSWAALEATSRALAERSEWARLAQIVDRTRRRVRDRGIDTGPGQWSFWQFIISTGMLRHERITTPEQIMGKR